MKLKINPFQSKNVNWNSTPFQINFSTCQMTRNTCKNDCVYSSTSTFPNYLEPMQHRHNNFIFKWEHITYESFYQCVGSTVSFKGLHRMLFLQMSAHLTTGWYCKLPEQRDRGMRYSIKWPLVHNIANIQIFTSHNT